jgi:hypothetical protein
MMNDVQVNKGGEYVYEESKNTDLDLENLGKIAHSCIIYDISLNSKNASSGPGPVFFELDSKSAGLSMRGWYWR